MSNQNPSIEFFVGISEELSNVSLRRNKKTGVRSVVLSFETLKAIEKFKSFTERTYGDLRLIDSEGEIIVKPSSVKLYYGGEEGDDIKRVDCIFEMELEEHWERFMRFMHRYAEVNGMGYTDSPQE